MFLFVLSVRERTERRSLLAYLRVHSLSRRTALSARPSPLFLRAITGVTPMEQPKYTQKPSIPAVEVFPQPLGVEVETAPPQKEPIPPAPIELDDDAGNDAVKADQSGLRVMQGEGGNGVAEPASPAALPKQG
jgi:hypothetical protein